MPCDALKINGLFDGNVLTAISTIDGCVDNLLPEEREAVSRAVERRQQEFFTGRKLSRGLLAAFGVVDFPLLSDADRLPIWPDGIIGSISHCGTHCVAAIAKANDELRSLSVDVEPDEPLERDLWSVILVEKEMQWVESQSFESHGRLARLIFSAKEAVYKCVFPITRQPFEFRDLTLSVDFSANVFCASIQPSVHGDRSSTGMTLTGRLLRRDGLILCSVTLPRSAENRLVARH